MWTDLYINLQDRIFNHCCKQIMYPVDLEEVEELGADVFFKNKRHYPDRQKSVLENIMPASCEYCIESAPNSIKNVWNVWRDDFIEEQGTDLVDAVHTKHIEIDVGRSCDMACVYCGPRSSSTWSKELGVKWDVDEDLSEAWADRVLEALREYILTLPRDQQITFNLLGGEPLLVTRSYDIIEYLAETCCDFEHKPILMITTNLNCKPALIKKLEKTMKKTADIFEWQIAISIEDVGHRAERVRHGLKWDRFTENVEVIKGLADKIYITMTVNLISFPKLGDFVDWAFDTFGEEGYTKDWDFTLNMVKGGFVDVSYCSNDLVDLIEIVSRYKARADRPHVNRRKIWQFEEHMKNMYRHLGTQDPGPEFFSFWDAMNKRRPTNYYEVFPLNIIRKRYLDRRR
jgi:sulfatase maturation enzyme AslB (radical SAM superfamily)